MHKVSNVALVNEGWMNWFLYSLVVNFEMIECISTVTGWETIKLHLTNKKSCHKLLEILFCFMFNNHPFNVIFGSVRYLPGNSQELKCKYILLKLLPMISHFKCTLKMTLVAVDNFLYKRS